MKNRIPYTKPSITDLEIRYATDAAANGWGEKCYDYIHRFENLFKAHLGTKHAIATSSCTGALHMGLAALGVGPGDEVILADTNWIATAAPIVHLGAKPVLVDILPDSWCIDPEQAQSAITKRTKAIIATHIYGNLCEMNELLALGETNGIPIVEDAAEAIGSIYHGKRAGSMGIFGTFSFHGTKTITTGEGGMFVTNDDNLYEKVLTLSNHGRARGQVKQFWPNMVGFKYRLSNIQAAIGCGQVERAEELIQRKRQILHIYKEGVKDIIQVKMNPEPFGTIHGAWMPTVVFSSESKITRERLLSEFSKNKIDARVFFWPLTSTGLFETKKNKNAEEIAKKAINLPSYYDIDYTSVSEVIDIIRKLGSESC